MCSYNGGPYEPDRLALTKPGWYRARINEQNSPSDQPAEQRKQCKFVYIYLQTSCHQPLARDAGFMRLCDYTGYSIIRKTRKIA